MISQEAYSDALRRSIECNRLAGAVQRASWYPEFLLPGLGMSVQEYERLVRAQTEIGRVIVEGRTAGLTADQIMIHFPEPEASPNKVWVTDSHMYRTLLQFSAEITHPKCPASRILSGVEEILDHERRHLIPGLEVATLTPHFSVSFVETLDRQKLFTAGILWSGDCSVAELMKIVTGPGKNMSLDDRRWDEFLRQAMS